MAEIASPPPPLALRHVFRWDLDKTYLHTEFDTLLDLVRTAVEKPEGKRTVAGAATLIRELRAAVPSIITIVSGSPEQMRNTLESKLRLDGIQWDEFVLKPSLRNILRLRFRALRDQVGYKLPALLRARARVPADVPETLFGDDAEADALVYSLYADVLAGRVDGRLLTAVMEHADSYPDAVSEAVRLAHELTRADPVRRIFIHLDRKSDPEFFRRYGERVVPVFNYFQAALVLVGDGVLPPVSALHVAAGLHFEAGVALDEFPKLAADLVTRGHLSVDTLRQVADATLAASETSKLSSSVRETLAAALIAIPASDVPRPEPVPIDYLSALAVDRERWEGARRDAKAARATKSASRRKRKSREG